MGRRITMSSSEVLNIEAISKAIDYHNRNCEFPATAVLLNPFEVERLDWEEIKGVPIVGEPKVPTGRIHVLCEGQTNNSNVEEQIEEPLEVVSPDYDRELVPA